MLRLALFACLLISLSSCFVHCEDAISPETDSYLIFGHFYGECMGESCVEIFKLESTRLLEDTNDRYPSTSAYYAGSYTALPDSLFQKVNHLTYFLPQELFQEEEIRIGEPDAGDWGGFYLEYKDKETRQFWLIDKNKDNVPAYLHDFIDKLNEHIALVSQ